MRHRFPIAARILLLLLVLGMAASSGPASAGRDAEEGGDVPGASDHPALGRVPGSVIVLYERRDYEVLRFPLANEGSRVTKVGEAAGEAWRFAYRLPASSGPAKAVAVYEKRLREMGFQLLYRCDRQGYGFYNYLRRETGEPKWGRALGDLYCRVMRGELEGRPTVVAVYGYGLGRREPREPYLRLYLVSKAPLDDRLEVVTAEKMAEEMGANGRVALYGILFDTDSARLEEESRETIAEIARFLEANPEVRVYVVGHTDNTGGYAYNVDLSERRAASVVRSLVEEHGIAKTRLQAVGVGPVAPVASNASEEGRARNRRVELVAR